MFGPLDAWKGASGRRNAFQAATSAALVGVALMLRSAWQEYSLAAESSRVARSQASDSLAVIQDRTDQILGGSPPRSGSLLPSLSVQPTLVGGPGVVVQLSVRIGGGHGVCHASPRR